MQREPLNYESDGLAMQSVLFRPARPGDAPGVLVFPEAMGLGPHALDRAERLAGLGYVALACDYHGGGAIFTSAEEVMPIFQRLAGSQAHTRRRARDALAQLTQQPGVDRARIGAIGYCYGGTMALELARSGADLRAAAGFHSALSAFAPEDAANIKAQILVSIGADDPIIPPEQRAAFEEEMRAGGVRWRMNLYGGVVHSFTEPAADARNTPQSSRYDAEADRHSWSDFTSWFAAVMA